MEKNTCRVDHIDSKAPRWVVEVAFCIMVAAAVCCVAPLRDQILAHAPLLNAALQTVGMTVMYFCMMKGMKPLYHPPTILWWVAIAFCLFGFVTMVPGLEGLEFSAATAAFLPLIYLPLGILLCIWYRGRLSQVGMLMVVRVFVTILLPVLFFLPGWLDHAAGNYALDGITLVVEILYAWALRRVLV